MQASHFHSAKNWSDIGVNARVENALKKVGMIRPSRIQSISFSKISSGCNTIIADQTGIHNPSLVLIYLKWLRKW